MCVCGGGGGGANVRERERECVCVCVFVCALFVRLEENVKAREPADVFTVQGSSRLNGPYFQAPGCGHAGL